MTPVQGIVAVLLYAALLAGIVWWLTYGHRSYRRSKQAHTTGTSYIMASADRCTVHPQHVMVDVGYSDLHAAHVYRCACGKQAIGDTDENKARRDTR